MRKGSTCATLKSYVNDWMMCWFSFSFCFTIMLNMLINLNTKHNMPTSSTYPILGCRWDWSLSWLSQGRGQDTPWRDCQSTARLIQRQKTVHAYRWLSNQVSWHTPVWTVWSKTEGWLETKTLLPWGNSANRRTNPKNCQVSINNIFGALSKL